MKALIVDDERLARNELRRALQSFPEISVIDEGVNGLDAINKINTLLPDLVFLDVQMPGKDGFAVLEEMEHLPAIVFTTAFDEYAFRAFEVNALDYLLKPIDPPRLKIAVHKVVEHWQTGRDRTTPHSRWLDHVFVRDGERFWFVKADEILLLESEGNYSRVHFRGQRPLVLRSLNSLETRLDDRVFFRANRRQIVNLKWIESIDPTVKGGILAKLKGGTQVEFSRRQALEFRLKRSL